MQNLKPQIHIMFRKAIMMGPSKADLLRALEETCGLQKLIASAGISTNVARASMTVTNYKTALTT